MIYLSHSSISRAEAGTTIFVDSSAKLLQVFNFLDNLFILLLLASAKETDACNVIYDLATSCLNLPIVRFVTALVGMLDAEISNSSVTAGKPQLCHWRCGQRPAAASYKAHHVLKSVSPFLRSQLVSFLSHQPYDNIVKHFSSPRPTK